jgi:hypothetical protein
MMKNQTPKILVLGTKLGQGKQKEYIQQIQLAKPGAEILTASAKEAAKIIEAERKNIKAVIVANIAETGLSDIGKIIRQAKDHGTQHFAYDYPANRIHTERAADFSQLATFARGILGMDAELIADPIIDSTTKKEISLAPKSDTNLQEFLAKVNTTTREQVANLEIDDIVIIEKEHPNYQKIREHEIRAMSQMFDTNQKGRKENQKKSNPMKSERARSKRATRVKITPSTSKL